MMNPDVCVAIAERVAMDRAVAERQSKSRTLAAVVSGIVQSNVYWLVSKDVNWAVKDAVARLEEPPHPGLGLYLAGAG
jgi:uncharacterized membrane protein